MISGWILFTLFAIAIAGGCLAPAQWLPPLPNDKLLHFLAYGGLAVIAGHIATTLTGYVYFLIALLIAGFVIEILQNFVPGRKFCKRDMAANTAGILVAALLYFLTR